MKNKQELRNEILKKIKKYYNHNITDKQMDHFVDKIQSLENMELLDELAKFVKGNIAEGSIDPFNALYWEMFNRFVSNEEFNKNIPDPKDTTKP